MTDIQLDDSASVPTHVTHHDRGRRSGPSALTLARRLQAAFGAFLAPERLQPASNDNDTGAWSDQATSLADPLALPPDWHAGGDLLSLSFLPFDR